MTSLDRLTFSCCLAKASKALSASVVGSSVGGAPTSGAGMGGGMGGGMGMAGGFGFRGRSGGLGGIRPARTSVLMAPSALAQQKKPVTSMPAPKLANVLGSIARGPGSQISKAIGLRPLLGAGLENLRLPSFGKTLGDLPPGFQRDILNRSLAGNMVGNSTAQARNQVAQYMRAARRNPDIFSGNPEFYPWSQFRRAPVPGGQSVPVRFDGYYMPGVPAFTSFANYPARGFVNRSSGAAKNFNWRGIPMPTDVPDYKSWQTITQRYPRGG